MTISVPASSPDPSGHGVESHVLGNLTVAEEECFTFPHGLPGFPACKRFALIQAERPAFFWLQSVDCGSLTFLLVDPFQVVDDFYVDLPEGELTSLKAEESSQMGVLAIVTLPRSPDDDPTVNLQGLIVLNFRERLARQIILQDSPYGLHWRLDPRRVRLAS